MNINQAIAAKLKGATIDCTNCRYWMKFYEAGSGKPHDSYCARNRVIKTDATMCVFFDGHYKRAPKHIKFIKGHRIVFDPVMTHKSVAKAYRRYLNCEHH